MKKLLIVATFGLLASIANAETKQWLICQTPGEMPNVDFSVETDLKGASSIVMTVTQMSGEVENFRAAISAKKLNSVLNTATVGSLVMASELAEINVESFISKAAMVSIKNRITTVSMGGYVLKNMTCSEPK